MPRSIRRITDPNLIALGNLLAALDRGVLTMHELAQECGFTYLTVSRYCAAMHPKAIHITAWKQDPRGAYTIRIYKLGPGRDAVAPVVTKKEKARRMRVARQDLKRDLERQGLYEAARQVGRSRRIKHG